MRLKKKSLVETVIWFHLLSWVLFLPFSQLQMLLFGKRIITLVHIGVIEVVLLITSIFINNYKIKIDSNSKKYLLQIVFFLIIWVVGVVVNFDVGYYPKLYYWIYWIMPFVIIVFANQFEINIEKFFKALLILITIHACLIIIQHFSNNLIWPFLHDEFGNNFFYVSENYYNNSDVMVRCPGICISGLDAGILLIFGIVSLYLMKFNTIKRNFLILLYLIAIWYTGTRNIYIVFLFILGFILVEKLLKRRIRLKILYIAIIACVLLYTGMFFVVGNSNVVATKNVLTDTLSSLMRLKNWERVLDFLVSGNILNYLFGYSVWQSSGYNFLIDNLYLELLMSQGIVGTIIFLNTLGLLIKDFLEKHRIETNMMASFISAYFIFGVGNSSNNIYMTLIMICAIWYSQNDKEIINKKEKNSNNI